MPRKPFVRKVGLLFLANLVIGPVAGTFALGLLSGEPRLVFATDIAGVPIVVYALVPVAFAVIGFTVCGVFILGGLRQPGHRRQRIAVLFGAVAGALLGLWLGGGTAGSFAGLMTGIVCSLTDVAIWRAGAGTADLA